MSGSSSSSYQVSQEERGWNYFLRWWWSSYSCTLVAIDVLLAAFISGVTVLGLMSPGKTNGADLLALKEVHLSFDDENDDIGTRPPPPPPPPPPPVCDRCLNCHQCGVNQLELSRDQQEVIRLVQQGLTLDPEARVVRVRYPVNESVEELKDNYHQAMVRETSVERSLL